MKIVPSYILFFRRYAVFYYIFVAAWEYTNMGWFPYKTCPDWAVQYLAVYGYHEDIKDLEGTEYELLRLAREEWDLRLDKRKRNRIKN